MIVFKLILFTLFISVAQCRIPDKVYCANKECDGPISKAKTLLSYTSVDPDLMSFRANSEAIIYMKSAGSNADLWYATINGKSGLVNTMFLREYKVIEKKPQFIVPYERNSQEDSVVPDKVQKPHEVFEGTTIYTTEAAVSEEQQDTSTESSPTVSNDKLTPELETVAESENQNDINNAPNEPSQETYEVEETVDEYPEEQENTEPVEAESQEINIDGETSAETIFDTNNEAAINNSQGETPVEDQPSNQVLHNELPPEALPPPQMLTMGSESVLKAPEQQEFVPNTLSETEQGDSQEQNISSPNSYSDSDKVQVAEETASEVDSENGNTIDAKVENPINEHSESPINEPEDSPTSESTVIPTTEPTVSTTLEPEINQNYEPQQVIPPIYNYNTGNQGENIPPIVNIEESSHPAPDSEKPMSAPPLESLPTSLPLVAETIPPTTETIPPLYPEVAQPLPTQETIPPIMNYEAPPTTEISPPELASYPYITTPSSEPASELYAQETTPVPDTDTSTVNVEDLIASLPDAPPEISSTTTEAPPQEENTEGFFSNMYSTVADIFPSSTETPEPLYNTEFPTHESEKADGNEGFSFLKYFMSTYYSVFGTSEETKALFASVGETCYSDEYCDGTSNDGSNRLLTFLLTTASSVLLFTLGYYYIDNRRQDGRLIGTINSLQRDLLFTTKECEILKEELLTTKNKLAGIEDSSFGMDDMVQSLKEEINELKATNDRLRNSLDDNEKLLRVSENTAGELQNTLGEVENTLSELLAERANSEEQIVELNGKIQAFEEELITVSRERDNFQLKYVSAESALEEFKKQKKQLEDVNQQLAEAKNTIELQKHEIEALKDAIKELKNGMSSDVDVTSFIDHTEIKAKLSKALQEKNTFESKFETEYKERTRLAEELKTTQETLTTTSQSATEALTRLEVLGKYFQERENELLKELSTKESLWLSKQGESASTVEKMELLQQEIQRYKEKCDALTLELAEQESSRRSALSEVEARAHAAWLEARAARRDADAARGDAAALRRKLAALSALSAADGAVSPHHKVVSPLETAESPSLPPPLPPMFLPPPLLPPLPRPPPLGRLPSPHPPRYGDRRYSPDSRYSPGSRYSPDSRYSPETVRYSPDSRYSPRSRRSPYSPRSRRRSRSRESRPLRSRNGPAPADTETEYNSDSPSREPRRRGRYSRHSGPSSGSGCSSESDK
ncbi:transport and Golgi organization protein 1 isoform X1 [Trichoplusia ni]|uniref:Transport and Golgi organization protein 1 isoform X1 n=1 Tax=Trichoplusia ni TaxID=7111 RepID=A0A7E5VY16_TRINI|nr:transport and Golgi organization protein 1 isoform X1 [Trichoplusia ni]